MKAKKRELSRKVQALFLAAEGKGPGLAPERNFGTWSPGIASTAVEAVKATMTKKSLNKNISL